MEKTYTTTDVNKHVGDVLDAAAREPIGITRHVYRTKDIPKPLLDALLDSNADLLTEEK